MKGRHLLLSCLLLSVFLLCSSGLRAQTIDVLILDEINNSPVDQVEVFIEDYSSYSLTGTDGRVQLDTIAQGIFHFSKEGYALQTIDLNGLEKAKWQIILSPLSAVLEGILITETASFKESDKFHVVQNITSKEIGSTQSQTSADVLDHHGGVYVQKSQMGGGSPILRGFEANRVLLVVDGVRMNNAIYRSGHLQNAITVDASILQNVKVLFGPNSLAYGSDAIGGVVAYSTRSPRLSSDVKKSHETNLSTRYSSANNEKYIHAHVNIGGPKMASLTSISISDYGDLRSGGNRDDRFPDFGKRDEYVIMDNGQDIVQPNLNPNVQVGTAYTQYDLLQKFLFQPKEKTFISANFQMSTSSDVPRYDNLQEKVNGQLRYAEWYYGPQTRIMASTQIKSYYATPWYDKYILTAAYQKVDEDRVSRLLNNPIRLERNEDVNVLSFNAEFEKGLSNGFKLLYGFDSQWNDVTSTAFSSNVVTGVISENVLSRYANDLNRYSTYGLFGEVDWYSEVAPLSVKMGVRFSGNHWKVRYQNVEDVIWPAHFLEGISSNNQALTWSVSSIYGGEEGFSLRSMISSAFRAPNIDDLSKVRVNSDEITFPNPELSPEKSLSAEATLGYRNSALELSVTAFFTALSDAIIRTPFATPQGSTTYDNFGEILNVVANQNVQKAHISGISLNAQVTITDQLSITTTNSYTKGVEIREGMMNVPFAHIPPFYGSSAIEYSNDVLDLQFVMRYNGAKDISDFGGSVDNPDLATPIGSLSWTTYNLYSSFRLSDDLKATVAFENIADLHYRPFASGLSRPGRNLIIGLSYTLD